MIEGDKPKPNEIGETERRKFIETVGGLVRVPHFPKIPGTADVIDVSSWESNYKKGEESVLVRIPVPSEKPTEHILPSSVVAEVSKPLFKTDDGNTVVEKKRISMYPDGKDPKYYERNEVLDKDGSPIVTPVVEQDPVASFIQRRETAKALRSELVTPERYNDIMGTLNSLIPEDEVKE